MQLYFYRDTAGNFGDELNTWLWPRLLPVPMEQCFDTDTMFVGIGTILNDLIPERPPKKVVFSTGFGYSSPPTVTDQWRFFCVRGPLTASRLALPGSKAICDGAILLRELMEPARAPADDAAFMPHHKTAATHAWKSVCNSLSIRYIDPNGPVEHTLENIRTSSVLITEAMHGAIAADALRVPWIPIRTRPAILEFKWQDWSSSLGIEHRFEWLPPIWNKAATSNLKRTLHTIGVPAARLRLAWLVRHGRRRLSADHVFQRVYGRLLEAFHAFVDEARR